MKALLCIALLAASTASADQVADQTGIRQAVRRLTFTSDADGRAELETAIRPPVTPSGANEPLSGDYWPFWPAYLQKPSPVEIESIRFVTADVALVDGTVHERHVLLVMKKEESGWKIASVRFLRR